MNALTEDAMVEMIVDWVKQNSSKAKSSGAEINGDTDLVATGLLDSFGFVDLIVHMEKNGGYRIDLTDADPAEFAVVKGLCRIALKTTAANEDGNGQPHR